MKKRNNWLVNSSNSKIFAPMSILGDKIKFSHPQSSLLILGDYRWVQGFHTVINRLIIDQFQFCIYVFDNHQTNYFAQSLLSSGCHLHKVKTIDILDGNIDTDSLIDLFQDHQRLVISVKGISPRLQINYWKLLSLQIRKFFIQEKVAQIPYLMVWIDRTLASSDPKIFEQFRILGLWGENYSLRFTLSLDRYSDLSSPARTLFGIFTLFPGIPNEEVVEILNNLSYKYDARTELYRLYQKLGTQQVLVVSPSNMFNAFIIRPSK
jgi:uncharacterized membrane protein YwzB